MTLPFDRSQATLIDPISRLPDRQKSKWLTFQNIRLVNFPVHEVTATRGQGCNFRSNNITVISMRFDFDPTKSQKLRSNPQRGIGFEEAQEVFVRPYYQDQRSDDPSRRSAKCSDIPFISCLSTWAGGKEKMRKPNHRMARTAAQMLRRGTSKCQRLAGRVLGERRTRRS